MPVVTLSEKVNMNRDNELAKFSWDIEIIDFLRESLKLTNRIKMRQETRARLETILPEWVEVLSERLSTREEIWGL